MALNFYQVTAEGHIGNESIANVFWYYSTLSPNADPTISELSLAASAVKSKLSAHYRAAMVADYVLDDWRCTGWTALGLPSTAIPYVLPDGGAGAVTATRDGNAHTVVLQCGLADLVRIDPASSLLRRGHFAFGPLNNTFINNDGTINTAGFTALDTLIADLNDLININGTDDGVPCRVSFTASGVRGPNVTAYRRLITLTQRLQSGLRVSRNNLR